MGEDKGRIGRPPPNAEELMEKLLGGERLEKGYGVTKAVKRRPPTKPSDPKPKAKSDGDGDKGDGQQ